MAEIKWIKITTDIFDDEKIKLIDSMPDNDALIVIWFKLLIKAKRKRNRRFFYSVGNGIELNDKTMSCLLSVDESKIAKYFNILESLKMIKRYNKKIEVFRFYESEQRNRNTPEYISWRKSVFERDGYTCRKCGAKGFLNAHHIKQWADNPESRFEVENGLTLCEKCHKSFHRKVVFK